MWDRRLSKSINDPAEYKHVTDCVLREIEASKDPGMAKAQAIVHDIRTRNLYKFVDEYLLPQEDIDQFPKVCFLSPCSCEALACGPTQPLRGHTCRSLPRR